MYMILVLIGMRMRNMMLLRAFPVVSLSGVAKVGSIDGNFSCGYTVMSKGHSRINTFG